MPNGNTYKTHCNKGHLLPNKDINGSRRCLECLKEWVKRYNKDGRKKLWDAEHRGKTTGWTPELVKEKLLEQSNKCAICDVLLLNDRFTHPDHAHTEPPKPRGILCHMCNTGIGLLKEDVDVLKKAISYLERYGNNNA